MQLLPVEALEKLARLELIARGVVEGFVTGHHKSPFKGASVEFAEHRQYVPGDDVRDLDWRVYGKSDRYYIKQYIEETNLRATLLLDASGSMRYTGRVASPFLGKPVSKFRYAQLLAASLAYLMINQQDAVGLVTLDTKVRRYVPARSRASHLRVLLDEIYGTHPGNETGLAPIFHDIAERVHRRGMIIVISDLFDSSDAILNALHHFRHRRHEVIVLHIMADEELAFPFDRWTDFRDLEVHGRNVQLDPAAIRADYLDRVRDFIRTVQLGCGQMAIDYVPMNTRHAFGDALANYLAARLNRAR